MNEKPKPKPPAKKQVSNKTIEEPKKPYVRKPHLTSRPFQNHPGLSALKQVQDELPRRANRNTKGMDK